MAAHIGVTLTHGVTAPTVGEVNTSSRSRRLGEPSVVRNASGVSVIAKPKKIITTTIRLTGAGDAEIANITAGNHASGTPKKISARQTEQAEEFPTYEIVAEDFATLA